MFLESSNYFLGFNELNISLVSRTYPYHDYGQRCRVFDYERHGDLKMYPANGTEGNAELHDLFQ